MNETLQSAPAETGADDPEYQAYLERNPATESMSPLSYEDWRSHQPPGGNDQPESPPPAPGPGESSNSTSTLPGSNINYKDGHQVVITNNPTFNNNPNFNMGGNQVVGEGEISSPPPSPAGAEAPRQIQVTEAPGEPAQPEQPRRPEAGRNSEVDDLRRQLDELRNDLNREREQRDRQHQEQMQALRDISESIRQQNENIARLLEVLVQRQAGEQPVPQPEPEPGPEPEPQPQPEPEPQPPAEGEPPQAPGEQPPQPPAEDEPPQAPGTTPPGEPPVEPAPPPGEWPVPPDEAGQTAVIEQQGAEPPSRLRRIWNRIRTAYIGGTYRYIVGEHITEEEQGERRRSRWFKRALGAAAVAGITSLAWWLATRGGSSVHGHEAVTQFHGGAAGNHAFGLELPPGDHLVSVNGHDIITDSSGHTIVGQLKDGMFDRQGNVSQAARETFEQNGLHVTQEFLKWGDGKQHFITRVTK